MEVKKSPKADLEGKKTSHLFIGAILALSVMFIAFEWSEREKRVVTDTGITQIEFEEEIIPITEQEQPQQAPPPPQAPPAEELIEIMDNDSEVEESTVQASDDIQAAVEVKYTPVEVEEEEVVEDEIFMVVEQKAEFPGGMGECYKWLGKNLEYPSISAENGVQGQVILQFVVNKDGSIQDIKVLRSVDPYCDKEAIRVVGKMPKWKPAQQQGNTVRSRFTLPVRFKLN